MVFQPEEIAKFREEGYIARPTFFSAQETAAIQAEIERFKREGLVYNVATDGDGKTPSSQLVNLQLCPMSPKSPLFRALPFHPRVVEALSELIGDPVVLHLDQVFLKPAHHGSGTNWHQDNAYFKISDPLKGAAMWIAVNDATVANGTLHVIPGSHRTAYPHDRDPFSNHHIRCYPPEENAVPVELPAGGAVFFAYGTAHCTRGNQTDHDRAGAAFHFLNGSAIPADYFGNYSSGSYPHPVLTGPDADHGQATYGEDMVEEWEALVGGRK